MSHVEKQTVVDFLLLQSAFSINLAVLQFPSLKVY